jgi:hypothetical protein
MLKSKRRHPRPPKTPLRRTAAFTSPSPQWQELSRSLIESLKPHFATNDEANRRGGRADRTR